MAEGAADLDEKPLEVSIIYDRLGGNETIVGVFEDSLEAIREFRKLRGDRERLLSLMIATVKRKGESNG